MAVVGASALGLDYVLTPKPASPILMNSFTTSLMSSNLTNQTSAQRSTKDMGHTSVTAVTSSSSSAYYTTNPSSLRAAAESAGLLIGSGAQANFLTEKSSGVMKYANTLANEFDFLTPEYEMKWGSIDKSGFGPADILVDFASQNKMKVKGHTLVWHNNLPTWVNAQITPDQLRVALQDHIRSVVGHFKGRLLAWDVVNEAVDDRGGLRNSIFLQKLGDGYIADAFRLAHETDPDAILIYNDYGAEGLGTKSDSVYDLVRKLLADGVPIHGVGLQMHISAQAYPDPSYVSENVQRLTALGLKVYISEMDVRIHDTPGAMNDKLEVQRRVYHDVTMACVKVRGFMGVTFWDFTDAHSWITSGASSYPRDDAPLLFDASYNPKPAYFGVLDALEGK